MIVTRSACVAALANMPDAGDIPHSSALLNRTHIIGHYQNAACFSDQPVPVRRQPHAISFTRAKACASMNKGTVKFGARSMGNLKAIEVLGSPW